jgi:rRNA-processing protein FCF1
MGPREKVIFDTNVISGEENSGSFLGGRGELQKFSAVADILIPSVVIEEIRAQKHRALTSKRDSFLGNAFHKIFNLNEKDTRSFDIRAHIEALELAEPIKYELIDLTDYSVLPKIKDLAISRQAPFDSNSDKGFKDAYLYFTVLEYSRSLNEEDKVFLITNDARLKEAFIGTRVVVVKDFDSFSKYRTDVFKESYFLEKLQTELGASISGEDIEEAWLNFNGNWILKIKSVEGSWRIEVDFTSREILGICSKDLDEDVRVFQMTIGSFQAAHDAISSVSPNVSYLNDLEIANILREAISNRQIYWIASDEDVKGFLQPIFEERKNLLTEEEQAEFRTKFNA